MDSFFTELCADSDEDELPVTAAKEVITSDQADTVAANPVAQTVDNDGFITVAPTVASTLKRIDEAAAARSKVKRVRTSLAESGLIITADDSKDDSTAMVVDNDIDPQLPLDRQSNNQFLKTVHRMRREAVTEANEDESADLKAKKPPRKTRKTKRQLEEERPRASKFPMPKGNISDQEEVCEAEDEEDISQMKGMSVVSYAKLVVPAKNDGVKEDHPVQDNLPNFKVFRKVCLPI